MPVKHPRRILPTAITLCALAMGLLVACGEPAPTATPVPTPTPTVAPSPTPRWKDLSWNPAEGITVIMNAPNEWDWDDALSYEPPDGGVDFSRGLVPKSNRGVPFTDLTPPFVLIVRQIPVDDTSFEERKAFLQGIETVSNLRHQRGELDGLPTLFEWATHDYGVWKERVFTAFIDRGDGRTWWIACHAESASDRQGMECETMVRSLEFE